MNRTSRKGTFLIIAALSSFLLTGCSKAVFTQAAVVDASSESGSTTTTITTPNTEITTHPVSSAAAQPQPSASKIKDAENIYQNILQNKTAFYNTDDKVSVYLKNLKLQDGNKPSRYTITDMDGDGIPELVLELTVSEAYSSSSVNTYPMGSEVLRIQNEKVVGFYFSYRALETLTLKADGTFAVSGGAANSGYEKLRFSENACQQDDLAYCEPTGNNSDGTPIVSYFINKKNVQKAVWDTFCKTQNAKKDAAWNVLTAQLNE